jgi:hypothetical protein
MNSAAENRTILLWVVIALGLGSACIVGRDIGESLEAPFAILSNVITCSLALIAFVNPRSGLSIVVFQAMLTDEFKRIAVTQSSASMDLVITVLIGPLITICVLHLSIFIKAIIFRNLKVDYSYWYFQGAIASLTLGMVIFGEGDLSTRGQFAANVGLYMSLLPMISLLFPTIQEWRRFIDLQIILVLPSAIWGIKQYYDGFTQMEWDYAATGLSKTHSTQMLLFEKPRIFGFLGSASAFGCMSMYGTYALWQAYSSKTHRIQYLIAGLIMMVAVVLSTQRSIMLIPFIIITSYYMMLSPTRTVVFYSVMGGLLLAAILFSQWLLDDGLDIINNAIKSDSDWGQQVLNVNTFSDRLKGWTHFLDASTWSWFGTGASSAEEYAEKGGHDLINKILIKVGVAGLLPILFFTGSMLLLLHRIVWRAPSIMSRRQGTFLLACFVPILVMNVMGGGNLNTVPINLQIWSMLAGILVFQKQYNINPFVRI